MRAGPSSPPQACCWHLHLPQGLSSLLPSNISAQAGQSLSTEDVCRKRSFMLTALKNQSLKMSRCISELAERQVRNLSLVSVWEGLLFWKQPLFYWDHSAGNVTPVFVFLSFWWHGTELLWSWGEQPGLQKPCGSSLVPGYGIFRAWITVVLLEWRAGPNPMGPSQNLLQETPTQHHLPRENTVLTKKPQ